MSHIPAKKIRLDNLLVSKGLAESREKARALILEGKVIVNSSKAAKAGTFVGHDSSIEIIQALPYVSRGGVKLEAALTGFHIDVRGAIAMDVGASTGGFTDCLLQNGAERVYAIDVGYGQFAWKLRNDPRVVLHEKTNIRYLQRETIQEPVDIATIDVSFISLVKVIPKVREFIKPGGVIVALIKPQFEVSRRDVGKGGVVKDEAKRNRVIERITEYVTQTGFRVKGVIRSPLVGPKGNVEYLMYLASNIDLPS
jgi:23S rRNA (cytidine1920-2'-O)/16S rRNA (cytidine1409-2'-O)-methyltransferase